MKTFVRNRMFVVFLVCIAVFFVFVVSANAAEEGEASIAEAFASPGIWIFNAILYIVRAVAWLIIGLASMFLTKMFALNILMTPTSIPIVPIAWAALRDLTNGVFLLVILWISLTIIFNIEQWGGRKLLVNVVLVALLINFSLLLVTITVGASNFLANIFAKNMPQEPGTFIVKSIDAQNMGSILTRDGLKQAQEEEKRKFEETKRQLEEASKVGQTPIKDTLLASIGIQTAYAQQGRIGFYLGCGAGLLGFAGGLVLAPGTFGASVAAGTWWAAALCGGAAVSGAVLDYYTGWATGIVNEGSNTAIRLSGQILFLVITATTMLYGAIVLLIRYAIIIALSVISPLAFLAATVPSQKKYFDLWLSTLLRWSFFLPVFYLMMYLGFYIISGIDASATKGAGPASLDRMLIVFVGLIFMWMGLRIARQTGGAIADSVVSGLSKIGLFAAGGAAGLAMRGAGQAMSMAPEQTQKFAQGLRRIPGIGRKMEAGVMGLGKARKDDIETRMKEVDHYSSEDVAKRYRSAASSREKAAMAAVLAKRKDMNQYLPDENERKEAVKHAERFGVAKDMYKTNPHLIEKDNVDERIKEKRKVLKDADNLGLAPEAYDDDEVILGIITNIKGRKGVKKIAEEAPAVYQRIQDVMRTRQQQLTNIANEMDQASGLRREGAAALRAFDEYEQYLANEMNRNRRGGGRRRQRRGPPPPPDDDDDDGVPQAAQGL